VDANGLFYLFRTGVLCEAQTRGPVLAVRSDIEGTCIEGFGAVAFFCRDFLTLDRVVFFHATTTVQASSSGTQSRWLMVMGW